MADSPIYAQPTADENLVPGWNVQGTSAAQQNNSGDLPGLGTPGEGYAEAGVTGVVTTNSQPYAGSDSMNGSTGPYVPDVLQNESYSVSLANAPAGTNPTAVGAVITTKAALDGVVLSGLSLLVQTVASGDTVTYTVAGQTEQSAAAGDIIPAGAAITTADAGDVFVTVGL